LESLPFVELRFIAFLFGRYGEISNVKHWGFFSWGWGLRIVIQEGKVISVGEWHIKVFQILSGLKFNPVKKNSLYLDQMALFHEKFTTPSDFVFPFLCNFRSVLHSLDKPIPCFV
jgi:hypothetical protein